mgnify:CR=1 FL=1
MAAFWEEVFAKLTLITQIALSPSPLLALLGYVHDIPQPMRRYTAIALLLAKRELAIHWGNRRPPEVDACLHSLTHCNTTSEVYASLQRTTS